MKFIRPINDSTPNVTNPFSSTHKGVDYGYNVGEPVYASESGTVISSVNSYTTNWTTTGTLTTKDYGNYIKIKHDSQYTTLYAHLRHDSLLFNVGEQVKKGQKIAEVGNTGNSTGPHLHWELRLNEIVIDPISLMDLQFTNYFISSQPTMNNDVKKAVQFDRVLNHLKEKGYISDNDSNKYLDGQFLDLIMRLYEELSNNKKRAGKWDTICNKVYGPTDSNSKTPDGVYNEIQKSVQVDMAQIKELETKLKALQTEFNELKQVLITKIKNYLDTI